MAVLEEGLDLLDTVTDDESSATERDKKTVENLRRAHTLRLLGQLGQLKHLDRKVWFDYQRLLFFRLEKDVEVVVRQDPSLQAAYDDFIGLRAAELSNEQQANVATPVLWNPYAVGNWSFLLTVMWGAVLISKNWKMLGDESKASRAMIWAYVAVAVILLIAPAYFIYFLIWYFVSCRPQAAYVLKAYGKSYPRKGWLKPLLIGWVAVGIALTGLDAMISSNILPRAW